MAFLPAIKKIREKFNKDGGTDEQWNVLAPAVHYGNYDRVYPKPNLARQQLTQAEARTYAKQWFDILRLGDTPLPSLRWVGLKAVMEKIDPPIQSDEDYKTLFGVSKADFDKVVQPAIEERRKNSTRPIPE